MARYYFHSVDGEVYWDEGGTELESEHAAKVAAVRLFAQLLSERPSEVWRDDIFRLTVANREGVALFVLELMHTALPASGAGTK